MPADRTRRTITLRDAAEAAFKVATTKPWRDTLDAPNYPECQGACLFEN